MKKRTLTFETANEKFIDITKAIREINLSGDGTLHLFLPHTSCALAISEAHDPDAIRDVGEFMKNLAPRNLPFITHTAEGPDDSPSHMNSILLQQSLMSFSSSADITSTFQVPSVCSVAFFIRHLLLKRDN